MSKRINTINKKVIVMTLFVCLLIFGGLFLAFYYRERGYINGKLSFSDKVYQNYEKLRGNTEKPIESISENELTLKIYDVFLEDHEVVLKYDLMKNNTIISKQSIYSLVISDNNQSIDYITEYNAKKLAVLRNENLDAAPNFKDKRVKLIITIYYNLDRDSQSLSQDFEFNYAPDKIYKETNIEVNREFSYLNKQIKINRFITNGLYTLLECDYDYETISDTWYTFNVQDESGNKIGCNTASVSDGSAKYFIDMISKKVKVLYLYPSAHKYDANNKEKEETIPINEKIEIKLP